MLIDITLKITPAIMEDAKKTENSALAGHLGTHFDVMDKEFPLSYTNLAGIVFDVSGVQDREIGCHDIDLSKIGQDMFVAFYTGFIEKIGYGQPGYFSQHPELSMELIEALLEKGVHVIGLDFAGVRRGKEHTPTDQYCADRGTFIIENLVDLNAVLQTGGRFTAHIYPMNFLGLTGLPCRVIAQV